MDLEKLVQFNKREFYRLFGNYIKHQRQTLALDFRHVSSLTGLPEQDLKLIECGKKKLSQAHLLALKGSLQLDDAELINLTRITQIDYILSVSKELDEFFPR